MDYWLRLVHWVTWVRETTGPHLPPPPQYSMELPSGKLSAPGGEENVMVSRAVRGNEKVVSKWHSTITHHISYLAAHKITRGLSQGRCMACQGIFNEEREKKPRRKLLTGNRTSNFVQAGIPVGWDCLPTALLQHEGSKAAFVPPSLGRDPALGSSPVLHITTASDSNACSWEQVAFPILSTDRTDK